MYSSLELEQKLIEHEGIRKCAYQDSIGNWTIGVGRLVDSRKGVGLSVSECFYLLRNDINACYEQLKDYPWFAKLDDVRRDAIIELCFNLGLHGLLGFSRMLAALEAGNYSLASSELLRSEWAVQVGKNRSHDIAERIMQGRYL